MQVNEHMDLGRLAECMGDCATEDEARALRELLCDADYSNTDDIRTSDWLDLCEEAVRAARNKGE